MDELAAVAGEAEAIEDAPVAASSEPFVGAAIGSESPAAREASTRVSKALWDRHWHLLGHRSELAETNRYLRFEIMGEEAVAFNDGASVVVFDNRCPHRGARIYDGAEGKQRFTCQYHGWSYAKGRLFIPYKETFEACDPFQARLATYQSEWVGDFLFVSRAPDRPLSEQLRGVEETVAAVSRSIAGKGDHNAYAYRCDWKIAVENALDQYHVAIIHHSTLNKLKLEPAQDEYFGDNNVSRAAVGDPRVKRGLASMRRFFDVEYRPEGYIALYLFPFTFLTTTFGHSYSLQQFLPSALPDRTNFTSRFYPARLSEKIGPDTMKSFFDSSLAVNHSVFVEDGDICARIPTDSWSPEAPAFVSRGEDKIVSFRASMKRFTATVPGA